MSLSFRILRPHRKLLAASVLGVFLAGSSLGARALGQFASQPAKQNGSKPGSAASSQAAALGRPIATANLPAPRPGWTYPQRQTLTYEVDWRVFPAGTAVVHLEQSGDAQRVTVTGDSLGAFNLIFRVSDRFQSAFGLKTGCSTGITRQQTEGSRQVNADQQFSNRQSHATYDERTLITHSHRVEQTSIPACVVDPLSAIFYVASQPLQVGQQFHLPVVQAASALDVTVHVEAREALRTPSTTYQTLRVQPTWTNTVVRNSGNIWVWYTDDDRHIPVQVRARLFWGTITFRLTTIEQK